MIFDHLRTLKDQGKKIGITFSTFDLLHAGHIAMLAEAKNHCDYLIAGLQTDPTIDRPDTKNKPVQSIVERQIQLSACRYVDEVVVYRTEQDLVDLLLILPLDVRVLGVEYADLEFTGKRECLARNIAIVFNGRDHSFSSSSLRKRVMHAEIPKTTAAAADAKSNQQMLLYVNGCSHSLGHGTATNDSVQDDDPNVDYLGRPENIANSFGAILARKNNWSFVCQARSGGSLQRSIRTTKTFLDQTQGPVFVLLGVPSSEREEWFFQGSWYAISAGQEKYPSPLMRRYKEWVASWEKNYDYHKRQVEIHAMLVEFHEYLNRKKVPHLFFNTVQTMQIDGRFEAYDWKGRYYCPYGDLDDQKHFWAWCKAQGFKSDEWGHFGSDAHLAWAEHIEPKVLALI
jgi:glycerol-3-phosphate cytidylyltransferase